MYYVGMWRNAIFVNIIHNGNGWVKEFHSEEAARIYITEHTNDNDGICFFVLKVMV